MKKARKNRDRAALNSPTDPATDPANASGCFCCPPSRHSASAFCTRSARGVSLSFCNFKPPGTGHGWASKTTSLLSRIAASAMPSGTRRCLPWCRWCSSTSRLCHCLCADERNQGLQPVPYVFFMPNLIGGIVLGYIWSMIFDGYSHQVQHQRGIGVQIRLLGPDHPDVLAADRLYDDHLFAGLQSVPEDMLEAARIDGAQLADAVEESPSPM